jgi:hypothetical protein
VSWAWIEGPRSFDIAWGLVSGALCLALASPILASMWPVRRRSLFGSAIDPDYRLQLAYGIFCVAMAFTNLGCRAIPHDDLPLVHPTFFLITLALVVGLGPRVIRLVRSS